jgi:hypothetical protein
MTYVDGAQPAIGELRVAALQTARALDGLTPDQLAAAERIAAAGGVPGLGPRGVIVEVSRVQERAR